MSGVNIRDLDIAFGGHKVIEKLNLSVIEGEFLVLLGPSGCGKSTLLHSIAGLIEVSGGQIEIGGQDMTWAEPSERGIGMVFQSYALYPTMTVERNMSFGLRVNRVPKAEIEKRVARAAEILQLGPLLARKPSQLSGGQRQRVAIGRALVREAGVFLFDEPLSNLDAKLRGELRRELKLLHKNLGSTMVYVTHDQVEAMTLASRVVVMKAGQIQQIGTPAEVYEKPQNRFVAGFLGAPGMNFVESRIEIENGQPSLRSPFALALDGYDFQAKPQDGQAVTLGLRPEHISITADGAWEAEIQLVEPMGNHQVLWLKCGDVLLSAVVHEATSFAADQRVRFSVDAKRVSLFDQGTEARL